MGHPIEGKKTLLTEVGIGDAADICNLRNDERINKFLSTSRKVSVGEQEQWIAANLAKKDGYYFKILDKATGQFCGTASIYNVAEKDAEFGRYICTQALQAVETEYLLIKEAFESMHLQRIYCRTAMDNKKVWKQHVSYGFVDAGEEVFKNDDKDLVLKVQELTEYAYGKTDYSFIDKLLAKF